MSATSRSASLLPHLEPVDLDGELGDLGAALGGVLAIVVSWPRNASGSSASTTWAASESDSPWYCATTFATTWSRMSSTRSLLAVEVELEAGEPRLRALQPEPGVVVALRGLLGLVVEVVHPRLDVPDRGLRLAGCGARGRRT